MKNKTDQNWKIYCRARNKAKSVMRKHKRIHSCMSFENPNTQQLWSKLGILALLKVRTV